MNQNLAILPKPRIIPPKPLTTKIQTPKRLPQSAKYMTIVFGILQSDCIVFAADTEETGALLKLSTPKLYSYSRDDGENLVIGGAGSTFSVETIQQRLGKSFLADSASFEDVAGAIIKQFYDDHVVNQPDEEFWLVFGGSFKIEEETYRHRLWISERGEVRDSNGIAAIGAGKEIARTLLKKSTVMSGLPDAELAAVHVLRLVKEQAHYCGKESMVWTVSGPDVRMMGDRYLQRAEELSNQIDRLNALVFQGLFGNDVMQRMANSKMTTLRAEYAKLINDLEEDYTIQKDMEQHFRDHPEEL